MGRTYKEKFEKTEAEVAEKDAALAKLEAELKKARETSGQPQVTTPTSTGTASTGEAAVSTNDEKLAEAEALVSSSQCYFIDYICVLKDRSKVCQNPSVGQNAKTC